MSSSAIPTAPEAHPVSKAYLLDTTHCSAILKGAPEIETRLEQLEDAQVSTSVVSRGELMYMAHKSQRAGENLNHVTSMLGAMDVLEIDQDTADVYGRLKAEMCRHFGPKNPGAKFDFHSLGISDNDLWIAAVAV